MPAKKATAKKSTKKASSTLKMTIPPKAGEVEKALEQAAGELNTVVSDLKKKYKSLDTKTQKKVIGAVAGAASVLGMMLAFHKGKKAGVKKMKKKMAPKKKK